MEPRYAEIARIMFAKGEWIVPTVNGELYTDKPILYFWLVLIASKLVGAVNEWTVRLPPALAGLGVVLTTYAFGRNFFSARIGVIAAVALATTYRVIWESRWAHTDMVFVFLFALSMYFASRALLRKGQPNEILLAYGFMGLATLTKGLIGVVLPALILVTFMAIRREWRLLVEAKLPLGIVVFLAVAGPWFYLVSSATEGKWLTDFIYIHHIQRYTTAARHGQSFYYYFTTLPADFLPWTIFALPALFVYRLNSKLWNQPNILFFLAWFFAIFLFFSLSNTKRDLYLLPLFPPAALFIANYMDDLISGSLPQSLVYRAFALVFFGVLPVVGLALPVAAWMLRPDALWISLPAALVMAAGGLVPFYFILKRKPWNVFMATSLLMAFIVACASLWILPYLEQFKSRRPFALEIKKIVPAGAPLYIYADTMNDFNYYLEREVILVMHARAEVEKLLSQPGSGYMLIKNNDLDRLDSISQDRIIAADAGRGTWSLIVLNHYPSHPSLNQ